MNEYNSEYNIHSLHPQCPQLTVVATAAPPKPRIISHCWNTPTVTTPCGFGGPTPAIVAGSSFEIAMDTYNTGGTGKVKAVFKDGTTVIGSIENPSFPTCTGDQCISPSYQWFPKVKYTMPNRTVQLAMELYGWDSSKGTWILTDSGSAVISTTIPGCSGIELLPYTASIKLGEKVDLAVTVWPGNIAYNVTFKDRAGTVLGTCKTSGTGTVTGGSPCSFIWDSMASYAESGKTGTYYVRAYADGCTSTECVIVVGAPILQYNLLITVKDSVTGNAVSGATVLANITGGASQSKITDTNGLASFRMDAGTINVSISKNGYNTFNTAEYLFMDRSITYSINPIPPTPTVGDIEFISIPTGADIIVDGKPTNVKTPTKLTGLTAGSHTWELRLIGYNNSSGSVIVPSGGTASVYTTLTPVTPTAGSLNITSHPMGAEVWIDGKDYKVTTSGATIITDIPPGIHEYALTMPGFQDKTGTFNIIAGQTIYLDVELIPLITIGTLEITSEPSGARVFIDDADTQRVTPTTIVNLTEGDHRYKTVLSGYKDIIATFVIKVGETTKVHLILEKSGVGLEVIAAAAIAGVAILSYISGKEKK